MHGVPRGARVQCCGGRHHGRCGTVLHEHPSGKVTVMIDGTREKVKVGRHEMQIIPARQATAVRAGSPVGSSHHSASGGYRSPRSNANYTSCNSPLGTRVDSPASSLQMMMPVDRKATTPVTAAALAPPIPPQFLRDIQPPQSQQPHAFRPPSSGYSGGHPGSALHAPLPGPPPPPPCPSRGTQSPSPMVTAGEPPTPKLPQQRDPDRPRGPERTATEPVGVSLESVMDETSARRLAAAAGFADLDSMGRAESQSVLNASGSTRNVGTGRVVGGSSRDLMAGGPRAHVSGGSRADSAGRNSIMDHDSEVLWMTCRASSSNIAAGGAGACGGSQRQGSQQSMRTVPTAESGPWQTCRETPLDGALTAASKLPPLRGVELKHPASAAAVAMVADVAAPPSAGGTPSAAPAGTPVLHNPDASRATTHLSTQPSQSHLLSPGADSVHILEGSVRRVVSQDVDSCLFTSIEHVGLPMPTPAAKAAAIAPPAPTPLNAPPPGPPAYCDDSETSSYVTYTSNEDEEDDGSLMSPLAGGGGVVSGVGHDVASPAIGAEAVPPMLRQLQQAPPPPQVQAGVEVPAALREREHVQPPQRQQATPLHDLDAPELMSVQQLKQHWAAMGRGEDHVEGGSVAQPPPPQPQQQQQQQQQDPPPPSPHPSRSPSPSPRNGATESSEFLSCVSSVPGTVVASMSPRRAASNTPLMTANELRRTLSAVGVLPTGGDGGGPRRTSASAVSTSSPTHQDSAAARRGWYVSGASMSTEPLSTPHPTPSCGVLMEGEALAAPPALAGMSGGIGERGGSGTGSRIRRDSSSRQQVVPAPIPLAVGVRRTASVLTAAQSQPPLPPPPPPPPQMADAASQTHPQKSSKTSQTHAPPREGRQKAEGKVGARRAPRSTSASKRHHRAAPARRDERAPATTAAGAAGAPLKTRRRPSAVDVGSGSEMLSCISLDALEGRAELRSPRVNAPQDSAGVTTAASTTPAPHVTPTPTPTPTVTRRAPPRQTPAAPPQTHHSGYTASSPAQAATVMRDGGGGGGADECVRRLMDMGPALHSLKASIESRGGGRGGGYSFDSGRAGEASVREYRAGRSSAGEVNRDPDAVWHPDARLNHADSAGVGSGYPTRSGGDKSSVYPPSATGSLHARRVPPPPQFAHLAYPHDARGPLPPPMAPGGDGFPPSVPVTPVSTASSALPFPYSASGSPATL